MRTWLSYFKNKRELSEKSPGKKQAHNPRTEKWYCINSQKGKANSNFFRFIKKCLRTKSLKRDCAQRSPVPSHQPQSGIPAPLPTRPLHTFPNPTHEPGDWICPVDCAGGWLQVNRTMNLSPFCLICIAFQHWRLMSQRSTASQVSISI